MPFFNEIGDAATLDRFVKGEFEEEPGWSDKSVIWTNKWETERGVERRGIYRQGVVEVWPDLLHDYTLLWNSNTVTLAPAEQLTDEFIMAKIDRLIRNAEIAANPSLADEQWGQF